MKAKQIILLIALAVGIAALVSLYSEAGTKGNFAHSAKNPDREVRVKTTLIKEKGIDYNPEIDPEKFVFFAIDEKGEERKVICFTEKPYDFERSEEVVIVGKVKGDDEFVASKVQIKCPSKYEDEISDI